MKFERRVIKFKKINSFCPFCNSEAYPKQTKTEEVIYKCGSSGSRLTGIYYNVGCCVKNKNKDNK